MPFSFKPTEASAATGDPSKTGVGQAVPHVSTPNSNIPNTATPTGSNVAPREHFPGEKMGIVEKVLLGIFGLMVIIAIFLFGYNYFLNTQVDSKRTQLDSYEKEFSNLSLKEMQSLSSRIKIVSTLVKDHPSVLAAFRILEESIENPIVYKSFDFHFSDTTHSYELALAANSPDYRSVVDQVDTFKRKPFSNYIRSLTISGLRPDTTGKVTFNIKMPIAVAGVLPEGLTLSDIGESIPDLVSTTTEVIIETESTSTSQVASSTPLSP